MSDITRLATKLMKLDDKLSGCMSARSSALR